MVKPLVFAYSVRVEWLGLDGRTQVNNSMRVEWKGVDFTERRAICEVEESTISVPEPKTVTVSPLTDSLSHTARCFLHLLVFAALIFVLGRTTGFRIIRVHVEHDNWNVDPLVCDWRYIDPPTTPNIRLRRCISAGPILKW
jgi:hypothetical protein